MRCFIAIEMPANIRQSIADVIEKCNKKFKGIKWVAPEKIHITLKFLGEVNEGLMPEIQKRLARVCAARDIFSIAIKGAGAFPNFKYPNVLWIGIDESEELKRLYEDIEDVLSELGFERESRKYSPHLTIGRVKDRKGIEPVIKEIYTFKDAFFGSIDVNEILLMRSVLKSEGAEYSKIAGFQLSKSQP
jgi:2'-5' RNA ligase